MTPYAAIMDTTALELQLNVLQRRLARPVRLTGPSGYTVLDRPAYLALRRIVDEGPLRPTTLAGRLEVDLSVVSRQVRALEEAGLVQRRPDPADARAALVSVTEAGSQALEQVRQQRAAALGDVVSAWPPGDIDEFVRMLTRFNDEAEVAIKRRALE